MKAKTLATTASGIGSLFLNTLPLAAQSHQATLVRLAELEIEPTQFEAYKTALREEIETSIRGCSQALRP